mgnify:CR=1 FL=1
MIAGTLALLLVLLGTGLLIAAHRAPTGLDPVRDAVSDYGTTAHHLLYRAMVIALGAGAVVLALGLGAATGAGGLAWLWAYGLARIAIAGFMTDRDPPPFTTEGRVHWLLAAVAFTSIALAATGIDWDGSPGVLGPLGAAVAATAIGTLLTRLLPPLRPVFGLVERLLYASTISWLIVASLWLIGNG